MDAVLWHAQSCHPTRMIFKNKSPVDAKMIGVLEVPPIETTASEVATILTQSPAFIQALQSNLSADAQFVSQASEEVALDLDFIQSVSELVAQNPSIIQEVVQELKTNVTFNTNIASLVGNNPSIQTIIQQNLIDSPVFVQNLVQVLEEEGIGSGAILPEHTVYVSPQWLPEPNPSLPNTHYFTNLADANDFVSSNQSSIDEPWAIVVWPGVYDAMNLASLKDNDPKQEVLQRLITLHRAKVKIIDMMKETNECADRALTSTSLVQACIASSKVASFDAQRFSSLYQAYALKLNDLDKKKPKIGQQMLEVRGKAEVHSVQQANAHSPHSSSPDITQRVRSTLSEFVIPGSSLEGSTSTLYNNLRSGNHHAPHRLLLTTLESSTRQLLSLLCTERKTSDASPRASVEDSHAPRPFVPPALILPLNVHIRAAIPGTVFMNYDIVLQSDASSQVGSSNVLWNTVSGINLFDNVISWDCEQFDYLQPGTPGVAFINCSAASLDLLTPDVNVQILGPNTFPTASSMVPRFQWRDSLNVNIRNFSSEQFRGVLQIDNCREFFVSIFDQDTGSIFVNQSQDVWLGTSSCILRSRNNELDNPMSIIALSSGAGFAQMPVTDELGSFNLQVMESYWTNSPSETIQGPNSLYVSRGHLSSFGDISFSTTTSLRFEESIISGVINILSTAYVYIDNCAVMGTLSVPAECDAFNITNSFINTLEFNSHIATVGVSPSIEKSSVSVLRALTSTQTDSLDVAITQSCVGLIDIRRGSVNIDIVNSVITGLTSFGTSGSAQGIANISFQASECAFLESISFLRGNIASNDPNNISINLLDSLHGSIDTARGVPCTCSLSRTVAVSQTSATTSPNLTCENPSLSLSIHGCSSASGSGYDAGLEVVASSDIATTVISVTMSVSNSSLKRLSSGHPANSGSVSLSISHSLIANVNMEVAEQNAVQRSFTAMSCNMQRIFLSGAFNSMIAEHCFFSTASFDARCLTWRMFSCKSLGVNLSRRNFAQRPRLSFVCCDFESLYDTTDFPIDANQCQISLYTTMPTPFANNFTDGEQYDKSFNHCNIDRTLMSSNFYLCYQHCKLGDVILNIPNSTMPLAKNTAALNMLHCVVDEVREDSRQSLNSPTTYLRLFVKSCQITRRFVLNKTPVATTSINPTPAVNTTNGTFPYIRTDSAGPAIFFESDINELILTPFLLSASSFPSQAYTLIRCTVREGRIESSSSLPLITVSTFGPQPVNSNLLGFGIILGDTVVNQVPTSSLQPLTFW